MPPGKDPDKNINPNVHKRILRFLNAARRPEDLTNLPANKIKPLIDPEHRQKRPTRNDAVEEPCDELCKIDVAKTILEARDQRHPLEFRHVEELQPILNAAEFGRTTGILKDGFGGATYGSWSDPVDLEDEDERLTVVHAAVVNTGEVLMIQNACNAGISKTPLWNPETKTLSPSPIPPSEGLYCSGHCFLTDGKLLVVGGRGDAGDWPNDKDITWLYDPATKAWDVTRDKPADGSPPQRTKMHFDRWYPTLVNVGDESGRVLIASGDNTVNRWTQQRPPPALPPIQMEVYSEQSGEFQLVTTPEDKYHRPTYPGLHLLPGGEIFFAPVGFRTSGESTGAYDLNEDSAFFDFTGAFTGEWTDIGPNDRTKGMSVQLLSNTFPFVQVMTAGGGDFETSRTYQMIDLSAMNPSWDAAVTLPTERGGTDPISLVHPNLVLLPDGTLFVCGSYAAGHRQENRAGSSIHRPTIGRKWTQ